MSEVASAVKDVLAGTVGGICTVVVGHPFDTIKVRLQTQFEGSQAYKGTWDACVRTLRVEGVRGFYKGVQSPLLGEGVFNAWQFFFLGSN